MRSLAFKESLKNRAPLAVRKAVRETLKLNRQIRNDIARVRGKPSVSKLHLLDAIDSSGIRKGDTVLLHSSLSRLGYVEGGARMVVDAFLDVVGRDGTIGAPTFWTLNPVRDSESEVYDVLRSPSVLGAISEEIRTFPSAFRSLHPTHCASFVGRFAHHMTKDHHLDRTPVGSNSPYFKLTQCGGKIALLGVTLEYLTSLHTIDDVPKAIPFNVYRETATNFHVKTPEGKTIVVSSLCHSPEMARQRNCSRMEPHLRDNQVLRSVRVGQSDLIVLDAGLLHQVLLDLSRDGITMYTPNGTYAK